jgi:hypothetical protein
MLDDTTIPNRNPTPESGFILVSVIWIAGLLAVMAAAFTIGIRSYTLMGRNVIQGERAQAMADGMVRLAAYELASQDLAGSPHIAAGYGDTPLNRTIYLCSSFTPSVCALKVDSTAPSPPAPPPPARRATARRTTASPA